MISKCLAVLNKISLGDDSYILTILYSYSTEL